MRNGKSFLEFFCEKDVVGIANAVREMAYNIVCRHKGFY